MSGIKLINKSRKKMKIYKKKFRFGNCYAGLGLMAGLFIVLSGCMCSNKSGGGGYVKIFDGKTLKGWEGILLIGGWRMGHWLELLRRRRF